MDFGAVSYGVEESRALEDLGYSFIGQGDYLATFTHLFELAQVTSAPEIGSFIMTSYGRHPAVAAMEATKVQAISRGRLVLCIGRGFRSAALMGRSPIPLEETREFVRALRSLVSGEPATWDGHAIPALDGVEPVPVFVSAYGPRVRRLAGAVGDGVVLAAGSSVADLEGYLADVELGARAVDRDPAEVDVWLLARASVAETRQEALDDVRGLLAASAFRHLRSSSQFSTVPLEHRDALEEFRHRYDPNGIEGYQPSWDGPNAGLVVELGLEDYLAGRFAIVGTPTECREQVRALDEAGVDRIVFAPGARSGGSLYERMAEALISRSS